MRHLSGRTSQIALELRADVEKSKRQVYIGKRSENQRTDEHRNPLKFTFTAVCSSLHRLRGLCGKRHSPLTCDKGPAFVWLDSRHHKRCVHNQKCLRKRTLHSEKAPHLGIEVDFDTNDEALRNSTILCAYNRHKSFDHLNSPTSQQRARNSLNRKCDKHETSHIVCGIILENQASAQ